MTHLPLPKFAYVLKRYPRFSETFVVNEILAHEAAGCELEIFSLRPPEDTHFQDAIARVRAPVTYLRAEGLKAAEFWQTVSDSEFCAKLDCARGADVREVYQAVLLARAVQSKGIRHLHAHFATSASTVARLAGHFAGIPYSFTAHAKDIFHDDMQPEDLRRKLADAATVVTVSDFNAGYLRDQFGAARLQRIYNGLDLQRFAFSSPERREPVVLAAGRLIEKKGFGVLLDACALLRCRFRCQIIGTGELEDALRAQIARLKLRDRVEMLGARPQNELAGLMQSSAVFAAPCVIGADGNRDGLPTVLLEAMALGTPCVSTDVTGIPEVLRDGATGLMVRQHDAAGLAAAIEKLLESSSLRVKLATQARQRIEAEFDVERNAARLRELFVP
jgi:glycosyltransferase involved in cell wall biosynthesis